MIFLDNNASTRVFERVADAMHQFDTTRYANPNSAFGRENGLNEVITRAKSTIGTTLGAADPQKWLFTSGATESNNLAIAGAAKANTRRRHLIVSAIEHPSVTECARNLERMDYRITWIRVEHNGVVDPATIVAALQPDTLLVSGMTANNETGIIQPIDDIATAVKRSDSEVLIHTDASQAIGKVAPELGGAHRAVDLLSLTAHKFHGPKGTGLLFVCDSRRIAPILFGGGQQNGLRPGTETPAGAVGAASAIEMVMLRSLHYRAVGRLRDAVEAHICRTIPQAFVVGAAANRLPTTSYVWLPGHNGSDLARRLADQDIAIAAGSACDHGKNTLSAVALAMGLEPAQAMSCIRISLSLETTAAEIDEFARALIRVLHATPGPAAVVGADGTG